VTLYEVLCFHLGNIIDTHNLKYAALMSVILILQGLFQSAVSMGFLSALSLFFKELL